jgi:hypothetical protein
MAAAFNSRLATYPIMATMTTQKKTGGPNFLDMVIAGTPTMRA